MKSDCFNHPEPREHTSVRNQRFINKNDKDGETKWNEMWQHIGTDLL